MKRSNISAEISVFFALITAMILALFLSILESARTGAARLSMTVAANSSIDSLFSQYHRGLWKNYRLMGLEQYAYDQLTDEMGEFLKPYLEVKNWTPVRLEEIVLEEVISLTDENGEIFEEDVMDYMNYGIVAEIWDEMVGAFWSEDKINEYDNEVPEGDAIENISDLYDDHSVEAAKLEKLIGRLSDQIKNSRSDVSSAKEHLGSDPPDGGSFISALEDAIAKMEKIPGLVDDYKTAADQLKGALDKSRKNMEDKKAELAAQSKEISQDVWDELEGDIEKYESYVKDDGERRMAIEDLDPQSEDKIGFLKDRIEQAGEIMEEIEEARKAWEEARQNGESDVDTDEEFDERPFWEPLISEMNNYDHLTLDYESGIKDEEKEEKLEDLKDVLSGPDFLKLVLPDKPELKSEKLPDLDAMPSQNNEDAYTEDRLGLMDKVRMAWYVGSFFNYFGRGINNDEEEKGSERCEQEYILYGKNNDHDNVAAVVTRLIALRSGLNLVYLYKDSVKRNEASTLATTIAPLPPLTIIIQFLIMTVWSAAQAVMDVRDLLSGKKVPFMHDSESFYLDLDGLLRIADKKNVEDENGSGESEKGLSYQDYLKILLFVGHDSSMDYRIMDMIQLAMREGEGEDHQGDFRFDRLVYSVDATVNLYMSHMFTEFGFVKMFGNVDRNYNLSIPTAYSY